MSTSCSGELKRKLFPFRVDPFSVGLCLLKENSFFFRADPFQKGVGVQERKQEYTKFVYLVKRSSITSPSKSFKILAQSFQDSFLTRFYYSHRLTMHELKKRHNSLTIMDKKKKKYRSAYFPSKFHTYYFKFISLTILDNMLSMTNRPKSNMPLQLLPNLGA